MAKPIGRKRPEPANTAIALALISVVGTLGAAWLNARKTDRAAETTAAKLSSTRVEIGKVNSNTNGPDCTARWGPWRHNVSSRTQYLGVQRHVPFKQSFAQTPKVIVALTVVNLRPLDLVLRDLGYRPENDNEIDRLRQFHALSFTSEPDPNGFTVFVGVGLPARAGDSLAAHLSSDPPRQATLDDGRGFFANCKREQEDQWMLKFYEAVGTLEVAWVAQAQDR